ncbi:MAG: hypothetical protein HIU87_13300 [Acidobacteria bacterium]|nr:hypothetical protein [Acidobacteriota bacterium]
MKCEQAQENIALAVYGELADDARHELELHLALCISCQRELDAVEGLQKAMSLYPVEEPSANLVTRARLRLEEALDSVPHSGWLIRIWQSFYHGAARLSSAPVMASSLLVLGLAGGAYGGYRAGLKTHDAEQARLILSSTSPSAAAPAQIANVSSIIRDPNSENVEVRYNRLVPETVHGSLDDPHIRELLLLGMQNGTNPAVSDNSVDLLANECRAGHACEGGPVRTALMVALRYDKSPSVRLKALDGLQHYIPEDPHVRDAVLEALMNDHDPQVRSEAVSLLTPVEADSSVREVLHTVAAQDENAHIRTVSQQVLSQMPEIQ